MRNRKTRIILAALTLLVAAFEPAAAASRKASQKTAPPEQPANASDDAGATAAAARAILQPVKVVLMPAELGWIKNCPDSSAAGSCFIQGGFITDPAAGSSMEIAINLLPVADTHLVQVILPLGLKLRPGFALTLGGEEAHLGAFDRCEEGGCIGEVVLSKAAYAALMKAQKLNVVFSNARNRTVTLEGPTGDMATVAAGPPVTAAEFEARQKDAFEKRRVAVEAYQAQVQAEKARQESATGAAPSGANEAKAPAAAAPPPAR